MNQLKNGKAPGECNIYAKMPKAVGATTILWLHTLLCSTRGSSRTTGDGALSFRSGEERMTRVLLQGGLLPFFPNRAKSWHEFFTTTSAKKRLTHQRYEHSGFTPKKSTVDRTLALRFLTERLCDFRIGIFPYMDLRKAFDSVNRDVLGRILAPVEYPQSSSTRYSSCNSVPGVL